MATYNYVSLMGTIYNDIQEKQLPGGASVLEFTLEADDSFKKASGETVSRTLYMDVAIMGNLVGKYQGTLKKGDMVIVEGHIKFSQWEKDGIKRTKHNIGASNVVLLRSGTSESRSHATSDKTSEKIEIIRRNIGPVQRVKDGIDLPEENPF